MIFQTMSQIGDTLKGIIQISRGSIQILNGERVRGALIDRLFATAILHEKAEMRGMSRWIIKMTGQRFGLYFSPVEMLYTMIKSEANVKMTLPVFSTDRGMTLDSARAIFLAAAQMEVGFFLFQSGGNVSKKKPMTDSPEKQSVMIVAAAIQAVFTGPIFFTSDALGESGVSTMKFPGFPQDAREEDLALLGKKEARLKETIIRTFKSCGVMRTREKVKKLTQGRETTGSLRDEISVALSESATTPGQAFIASLCSTESG